jgi:hypothetical protein
MAHPGCRPNKPSVRLPSFAQFLVQGQQPCQMPWYRGLEQVVIQPLSVKKRCPRNAERPLLEGGHDATFIYHTSSYKPGIKRELSLPRQAKCCLQIWSHSNPQEAGTYLPAGGDFAFTVNLVERRVTCYDPRYSW